MSNPTSRRLARYLRGNTRRERALACAQELLALQRKESYAEFSLVLERAIQNVRFEGRRTDENDGDRIITALREGCARIEEIADETGLSEKDTAGLLNRMISTGEVETRRRTKPMGEDGPPVTDYFLVGSPSGCSFVTRTTY